jgi:aminopeptidase N
VTWHLPGRWRRVLAAAVVLVTVAAGCDADQPRSAPSSTPDAAVGAAGVGDRYFPTYGNGGYDVAGYDLSLRYDPATDRLEGVAAVTATATAALSRFNLDYTGPPISALTVDGAPANSRQDGGELVVTPPAALAAGQRFTVRATYAGVPSMVRAGLGDGGWLSTPDGAVALGQPESATSWFPVNDHPSDKATYTLAVAVPDGVVALSTGVPGERSTADGWTTWRWTVDRPMASDLAMLVIGRYRVTTGTHRGRPVITAVPESAPPDGPAEQSLAATLTVTDFMEGIFGPYPFDAYGGIAVADERIRYALENQTRPVYGPAFFTAGRNTSVIAHEAAHQWIGDSVTIARWPDVWLNEGLATYAEWLWDERDGARPVATRFADEYARADWTLPPGDPGPTRLFSPAVYQRGAMTVHALRLTVGDEVFFRLLKEWTARFRDRVVTTADFTGLAEQLSGTELDVFFQSWLYGTARPPVPTR